MAASYPTYSEVIIYDRLTGDQYATLAQEEVHVPNQGDMLSIEEISATRDPGDEEYDITSRESQGFIVTAVNYQYSHVQYHVSSEPEDSQLIEQIWVAVEPSRGSRSE